MTPLPQTLTESEYAALRVAAAKRTGHEWPINYRLANEAFNLGYQRGHVVKPLVYEDDGETCVAKETSYYITYPEEPDGTFTVWIGEFDLSEQSTMGDAKSWLFNHHEQFVLSQLL